MNEKKMAIRQIFDESRLIKTPIPKGSIIEVVDRMTNIYGKFVRIKYNDAIYLTKEEYFDDIPDDKDMTVKIQCKYKSKMPLDKALDRLDSLMNAANSINNTLAIPDPHILSDVISTVLSDYYSRVYSYETLKDDEIPDGYCQCISCKKLFKLGANQEIFERKDNPKQGFCFKCY